MRCARLLVLMASACLMAMSASADDVIGYVKTARADATVVAAGQSITAVPGTPVHRGDVLKTGKQGSLGVIFQDNTIMSFGPDTRIVIDEYLYAPGRDELKLGATLAKGTLHYISGVIARLKPDAVAIRTPTGTIGVRGTRFVAKVEAQGVE